MGEWMNGGGGRVYGRECEDGWKSLHIVFTYVWNDGTYALAFAS